MLKGINNVHYDILQDDRFFKLIKDYSIYFNPASRLDDNDTLTVDSGVEKVIIQKLSFFT